MTAINPASLGFIADAVTNSAMQALAKELRRQGKGGLGDARPLRAAVREIVRRSLRDFADTPLEYLPVETPEVPAIVAKTPAPTDKPTSREVMLMPVVVRPKDACRMLSVGLTRLYELLSEDALESYLHGGSRRITIASINAYIDRQIAASGPLGRTRR